MKVYIIRKPSNIKNKASERISNFNPIEPSLILNGLMLVVQILGLLPMFFQMKLYISDSNLILWSKLTLP